MTMPSLSQPAASGRVRELVLESHELGRTLVLSYLPPAGEAVIAHLYSSQSDAAVPWTDQSAISRSYAFVLETRVVLAIESSVSGADVRELRFFGTRYPLAIDEVPHVRRWLSEVYGDV